MNAFTPTPQGPVVALTPPNVQDYPRLVYTAPYFVPVAMAELFEPAVLEAVETVLPSLIQPYIDPAAEAAVAATAVLLTGSIMTGPLLLMPGMPSSPQQAANKAYVDAMLSTAGIPEVPPVPIGQLWARETGQWVPIDASGGNFLPLTGGTLAGPINMSGNQITGLPAVPTQPDGAASAGWTLQQLAAVSLYQGVWNPATNVPDLTLPVSHQNAYTWICNPVATGGVVVTAAIPGLQGVTVYDGDTVIFSAQTGTFTAIHAGGLSLSEADARYLQLAGGQMQGALLLNSNPTQPMQAANMSWVQSLLSGAGIPEAPSDGQSYLRTGSSSSWTPGVPLAGAIMTGALMLSGNASSPLQAVPYQQISAVIPTVANPNTVWAGPISAPAAAPTFRTLSAADIGGGVLPVIRGGTGQVTFSNGIMVATGNVLGTQPVPAAGIMTSNGTLLGSTPLPLSAANGGTGLSAMPAAGVMTSTGTAYASTTAPTVTQLNFQGGGDIVCSKGGTLNITDQSGAGFGTIGGAYWYRIGGLVWYSANITWPSNTSGVNASIGVLPYTPVNLAAAFVKLSVGNPPAWISFGTATTGFMFQTANITNFVNSALSGVGGQFFLVYETNDPP